MIGNSNNSKKWAIPGSVGGPKKSKRGFCNSVWWWINGSIRAGFFILFFFIQTSVLFGGPPGIKISHTIGGKNTL